MKKKLLLFSAISIILLSCVIGVGYFQLKSHLPQYLKSFIETAKTLGVDVAFEQEIPAKNALIDLKKVTLAIKTSPYLFSAASLKLNTSVRPSWPPITLSLLLNQPVISELLREPRAEIPTIPPPPNQLPKLLSWLGLAFTLVQIEVVVSEGSAPPWGLKNTDFTLHAKNIDVKDGILTRLILEQKILIKEFSPTKQITLPNMGINGTLIYAAPLVTVSNTSILVGPISFQTSGKYDLASTKWSLDIESSEKEIKELDLKSNHNLIPWLQSVQGKLYFKTSSQGLGKDINAINTEGELRANGLTLVVNHPNITGPVSLEIDAKFKKTETTSLNADLKIDGSKATIIKDNQFKKLPGVPFNAKVQLVGNNQQYQLNLGAAQFHNLTAAISGKIINGPKITSQLEATIEPTSLEGWEQFFPSLGNIKTKGSLTGRLGYSGTFDDWKSASLELDLNAKEVQIPVLQNWIPNKEITLTGIAKITSDTKIKYSQGELKTLATNTSINLQDNTFGYSDLFLKGPGVPMGANLIIQSTAKEAQIKSGSFSLGPIKATLKGSISNFKNPIANLNLETQSVSAKELAPLIPFLKSNKISVFKGTFKNRISLGGPLTTPHKQPTVTIESTLTGLAFDYPQKNLAKTLQIKEMNGKIIATQNSLKLQGFQTRFPNSDVNLSLSLFSFIAPVISFNLSSNHLSSKDFLHDTLESKAVLVAVPVSSSSETENDFRDAFPILKKAKINGAINIKNAELNSYTAENLIGRVDWDKGILNIDPLNLQMFGGSMRVSTHWNGNEKLPKCDQKITISGMNINSVIESLSPKSHGLLQGRIKAELNNNFTGITEGAIKKSMASSGSFTLSDGRLNTINFTQKPLEALKKFPPLSGFIKKTAWEELIKDTSGSFSYKNEKLALNDMSMHSPYFDLTAPLTTVDIEQNVYSKVSWIPKETLLDRKVLDAIKDEKGESSIPLLIEGPATHPSVTVDSSVIEGRLITYAKRLAEEKLQKAATELKNKTSRELEEKLKEALGGLIKK
ncbi:MAG: hypothetical protein EXR74_00755 [Bdellovibrionales bacterium]|nr:hypothetical protein [Bdellovibrionales bacterium]